MNTSPDQPGTDYDVAVVGAGAAGLQAALTLGRMRRTAVVLGTDRYRNDPASHMQNFLGHDGAPPAELRAAARKDVELYPTVDFLDREVVSVEVDDRTDGRPGFVVSVAGGERLRVRRVVLATGVVDTLPDVPGLAPLFGDVVAHCPFCHGYELRDRPVAILGAHAHLPQLAAMMAPVASTLTVLTGGEALDDATAAALASMGVEVRTERLRGACRSPLGLRVDLDGTEVEYGGLVVATQWAPGTPFADQLGLETAPTGAVLVDAFARTSRDGVYAAGDVAQSRELPMPFASVLTAAAAGLVAGADCTRSLGAEDFGLEAA